MSYVIQNFYDANKKIIPTPRFKSLFFLINLKKFIIFIKLITFFNYSNLFNTFRLNELSTFFKYFFANQFFKILYKNNVLNVANYDNNIIKSYTYTFYYFINEMFTISLIKFNNNVSLYKSNLLYNNYLLPIKIINIKLSKTFFKNVFFFLFINNFFIWIQIDNKFKFYLNFMFTCFTWKIFRFYNTHFLRVYNY